MKREMPSFIALVKVPGGHGPQKLDSIGPDAKDAVLAFLRKRHPEMTDDGTVTADSAPAQIRLTDEALAHVKEAFDLDPKKRKEDKGDIYVVFDPKKGGRRKTAKKASRRRRTTRRR